MLTSEVFAFLLAVIVVISILSSVILLYPPYDSFIALGVLDSNCKMSDYPKTVIVGENLSFCIFLENHRKRPALLEVRVKIASENSLPTNETPSPSKPILVITRFLDSNANYTERINIPLNRSGINIAIVFELWEYNTTLDKWTYTGIWNHIYINATEVIPP